MNANDLLKNLTAPELKNPNFTNSFSQLISDINTNFKLLASAPFGVGGQGDSMVSYMEYLFVKSGDEILLTNVGYEVFKVLFPKADLTRWTDSDVTERKYKDIKSIINNTYPKINNIEVLNMFDAKLDASLDGNVCEWAWCGTELIDGTHQSVLPISLYQFYDQRTSGLSNVNNIDFEDMTASVFATLDESGNVIYKSLSIYPKLYFDQSNNYWAWMINNERTGINATGPKGSPGSAGSALLYNEDEKCYFYEGLKKSEDDMERDGILKEGTIRFRVVNKEVPEQPIRSELYLDAYSIIDGVGAWRMGVQLYKTLDNWLIKNYFDEIHARVVQPPSSQTLRVLGLPIFNAYDIDEDSGIGYPTTVSTTRIIGYHSIEPRRDNISGKIRDKLLIQPIEAADLYNKLGSPKANNSIPNCDIQILDYANIYLNKFRNPVEANIKNDSFSILNRAMPNKHTKQNIDGIEVLDGNVKSNLSSGRLLFKVFNYADGGNIINYESNILPAGLIANYGNNEAHYRADRLQMMNKDNPSLPITYNRISSNMLYIGTQETDEEFVKPNNTSKGFYVIGNTDESTKGQKYRTVLYDNTGNPKKSNTSTAEGNVIDDGTNTNEITIDNIKITKSISEEVGKGEDAVTFTGIHTNEITVNKIEMQGHVYVPDGNDQGQGDQYQSIDTTAEITTDNIKITRGTKTNTSTVDSNVIDNGTNANTIKANEIQIKIKDNNPYPTHANTIKVDSNVIKNGAETNTSTFDKNEIKNEGKTNTSKFDRNVINDGTNTNEITVDKIKITNRVYVSGKFKPVNAEINPYGGMLVPVGGIIMWSHTIDNIETSWRSEIPKGFIPCGWISNIKSFHDLHTKPHFDKLGIVVVPVYDEEGEEIPEPAYVANEALAISSQSATVIIFPPNKLGPNGVGTNPTLSGRYYKFNGKKIPNFPIPSYPVQEVTRPEAGSYCQGDKEDFDKFFYIMRAF